MSTPDPKRRQRQGGGPTPCGPLIEPAQSSRQANKKETNFSGATNSVESDHSSEVAARKAQQDLDVSYV
ncbi:MAG: hypothetical protein M1815_006140, partial [Lichina confinis]